MRGGDIILVPDTWRGPAVSNSVGATHVHVAINPGARVRPVRGTGPTSLSLSALLLLSTTLSVFFASFLSSWFLSSASALATSSALSWPAALAASSASFIACE